MSVVTGQEADRFKNQYCCRLSVAQHLCAVFQSALCRCASYPSRAKLSRMNLRLGVQAGFVPAGLFKWPQCHHKPFIRKLADRARRARCTLKDSMASAPSSTSAPSATSACVAPRARPCLVRMRQDHAAYGDTRLHTGRSANGAAGLSVLHLRHTVWILFVWSVSGHHTHASRAHAVSLRSDHLYTTCLDLQVLIAVQVLYETHRGL